MNNWPAHLKLHSVLSSTKDLLERSENDGWGSRTVSDSISEIDIVLKYVLQPKNTSPPEYLNILFGPTGNIHEISLANGWETEYGFLADEFESSINNYIQEHS